MTWTWKEIFEWIKLSPKYLIAVSITSGLLLFAPNYFINKLGLNSFIENYRTFIGVIFLFVNALLFAHILYALYAYIKKRLENKTWLQKRKNRLHSLTSEEKEILSGYILNNTRTQNFDITDGAVLALEHEAIIYRASTISSEYTMFPYNIQSWAWEYLNKNKNLLK